MIITGDVVLIRWKRFWLASVTLLGVTMSAASAEEVILQPARDTTIFSESGAESNGAGEFLFVGNTGGGQTRRTLIGFDFDPLPDGAVVTGASLEMSMSRTVAGDETVSIHRLLKNWGEADSDAAGQEGRGTAARPGDATWTHAVFPDEEWEQPGGDFVAEPTAATVVGAVGTYTWSSDQLVNDIQTWQSTPEENFGWILLGAEDRRRTAKRFNSRESNTPPRLTIQFELPGLLGDFDGNGELDFADINALTAEVLAGTHRPSFDLNGDQVVDQSDRERWVVDLKRTYFGDANLDLEFNTGDLVFVFVAAEYEDDIPGNSLWQTGDWNGDGEFTSSDFIAAFRDGGFEKGPRDGTMLVPEPSFSVLLVSSLLLIVSFCTRNRT